MSEFDDIRAAARGGDPSQSGALTFADIRAAAGGGSATRTAQRSLEDRVRQTFNRSLFQFEEDAFARARNTLADRTGSDVEFIRDDQGRRKAFVVQEKGLGGEFRPTAVPTDDIGSLVSDEASRRQGLIDEIEKTGGAIPLGARFEAGLKLTPAGKYNNLREEFGARNVFPVLDDENRLESIIIAQPGRLPMVADKREIELADMADLSGDILEAIPGTVASVVGGRLAGPSGALKAGALGDIGANVARQGVSELLPGEDFPDEGIAGELSKRAQIAGTAAASGVGVDILGATLRSLGRGAPRVGARLERLPAEETLEAEAKAARLPGLRSGKKISEVEDEAARLEQEFGVELTVGQRAGLPSLVREESVLRQVPGAEDILARHNSRQVEQLGEAWQKTMDDIAGSKIHDIVVSAPQAVGIHQSMRRQILKHRSGVGRELYGEASEAAGGKRVLLVGGFVDEAKRLVDDMTGQVVTKEQREIIDAVTDLRTQAIGEQGIEGIAPRLTIKDAHNLQQQLSQMASGRSTLRPDIPRSRSQAIGARLQNALRGDMESLAKAELAPELQEAGAKLGQANKAWAQMSAALDHADNALLEGAVKAIERGEPSKLVDSLVRAKPELIRRTIKNLRNSQTLVSEARKGAGEIVDEPLAVAQLRAATLQEMFAKSAADETGAVSPKRLAGMIKNKRRELKALFDGDAEGFDRIMRLTALSKRSAAGVGGGSQTAPFIGAVFALASRNIPLAAPLARAILNPKNLAIALTNPASRAALYESVQTIPRKAIDITKTAMWRHAARVSAISARERLLLNMPAEPGLEDLPEKKR